MSGRPIKRTLRAGKLKISWRQIQFIHQLFEVAA